MTALPESPLPLHGRRFLVTGAAGLGYETALELVRQGAGVILASRTVISGQAAVNSIRRQTGRGWIRFEPVDLGSLTSVEDLALRVSDQLPFLDGLVNNAGIMAPPQRRLSADGYEAQLAINHLGAFALTARLQPLLRRGKGRVVALSSLAARRGQIRFDDLHSEKHYRPMSAYAQSKLACLIFAQELQRRSVAQGWGITSIAAHPGIAATGLLPNSAGDKSVASWFWRHLVPVLFQSARAGAAPVIAAATQANIPGGSYLGPDGLGEMRGHPAPAKVPRQAQDPDAAARLWQISERLTGLSFS